MKSNLKKMKSALPLLACALILGTAVRASAQAPELEQLLGEEIEAQNGPDFSAIVQRWERVHGAKAILPLLRIAGTGKLPDPERYIALMGAAKLGGNAMALELMPFLSDSSWMIRSAALQSLRTLADPRAGASVLPLLHDSAMVVRREAVETIARLRPPGAVAALVKTLYAEENYQDGKALWIPRAALHALVSLKAQEAMTELRPLLLHFNDPELQWDTVWALEALAGRRLADSSIPLSAQVLEWEKYLRKPRRAS